MQHALLALYNVVWNGLKVRYSTSSIKRLKGVAMLRFTAWSDYFHVKLFHLFRLCTIVISVQLTNV